MTPDVLVTSRRTLQQILHCAQEALSAHENREDPRHVVNDLTQAKQLIDHALKDFLVMARGAERGGLRE